MEPGPGVCPSCLEKFDRSLKLPLKAPCSHIICRRCMQHQRRDKEFMNAETFLCPFDKQPIPKELETLKVVTDLLPGYVPPKPEQKVLEKLIDQTQTQLHYAREATEDAKENLELTRENIDRLTTLLNEKRARIDTLLEANASTVTAAVAQQEQMEAAALTLIKQVKGEPTPAPVLKQAATAIRPYSFYLSNYANVEEMDLNVNEIGQLLSEGKLEYEMGELTHQENEALYKYVNSFQARKFYPQRKRAKPRQARHSCNCCGHPECHGAAPMNFDLQVNLQDLLQNAQFSGDPEQQEYFKRMAEENPEELLANLGLGPPPEGWGDADMGDHANHPHIHIVHDPNAMHGDHEHLHQHEQQSPAQRRGGRRGRGRRRRNH